MSNLTFYQPNSFSFPLSSDSKEPWGGDKNMIHDVIRTPHNKIILFCSNFQQVWLNDLKVYFNGSLVQYETNTPYPSYFHFYFDCHIKAQIPPDLAQSNEPIEVTIASNGIQHRCTVENVPFPEITEAKLTLVTLQKDNHLCWIKDWCLYYHRVYGVDLIVLYDNGSHNYSELAQELDQLSPDLKIILIQWNFTYSMATQTGALNHCYQSLGHRSRYYLNFDLDEYLIYASRRKLIDYLNKRITKKTPMLCLAIPGQRVAGVQHPDFPPDNIACPRIKDLCYKHHFSTTSDRKTIFCYQEGIFIYIHNNLKSVTLAEQNNIIKTQNLKTKNVPWITRLRKKLEPLLDAVKRKIMRAIWNTLFYPYRPYFNHYSSLTLSHNHGWRKINNESSTLEHYNPKHHCKDKRMIRMLKIASLEDPKEDPKLQK